MGTIVLALCFGFITAAVWIGGIELIIWLSMRD